MGSRVRISPGQQVRCFASLAALSGVNPVKAVSEPVVSVPFVFASISVENVKSAAEVSASRDVLEGSIAQSAF